MSDDTGTIINQEGVYVDSVIYVIDDLPALTIKEPAIPCALGDYVVLNNTEYFIDKVLNDPINCKIWYFLEEAE